MATGAACCKACQLYLKTVDCLISSQILGDLRIVVSRRLGSESDTELFLAAERHGVGR
jgi:hypothetical protein